jgi:hypothetical protein
MDLNKFFIYWEILRFFVGIGLIYYFGDWFGLSRIVPYSSLIVQGYLLISVGMAIYFYYSEINKKVD